MKKTIILALVTSITVSGFAQTKSMAPLKPTVAPKKLVTSKMVAPKPTTETVVFKNAKDSASYALGLRIGQSLRTQGLQDVNVAMFNKGMATGVNVKSLIPDSLLDTAKPTLKNTVKCHYHGTLITGEIFDSSVNRGEPISFPLNGVIKGWQEALQLMTVGSKWKLFIPSELAYGERSAGPVIGPGSTLIFEVELLGIQ